jgi:hypothetical protein
LKKLFGKEIKELLKIKRQFMRKILITTGLIILWTLAVPIGFVAFHYFKKPPVERGDIKSLETHLVKRLEQAEKDKQLGSAGIALIQEGKVVAAWGVGIGNYEAQRNLIHSCLCQ